MVTVNINDNLKLGMEEILQGIARLGAKVKKKFFKEISRLTAGQEVSLLSKKSDSY